VEGEDWDTGTGTGTRRIIVIPRGQITVGLLAVSSIPKKKGNVPPKFLLSSAL
jgi:hypothetical protein